jgi:hypothetical protein
MPFFFLSLSLSLSLSFLDFSLDSSLTGDPSLLLLEAPEKSPNLSSPLTAVSLVLCLFGLRSDLKRLREKYLSSAACAASLAECDRCTDRLLLDIEAIREKTKYVFHAY